MAIQTDLITDSTGLKSVNVGDVVDGHCTAWVNFDGTTGAIRASFNVASVVRNALGLHTITFTTPMANANYTLCFAGVAYADTNASVGIGLGLSPVVGGSYDSSTNKNVNSVKITNAYQDGVTGAVDCKNISITFFGGK